MFYAVCDGIPGSKGPPFLFYKFKTLSAAKKCKAVNENSYVFDGKETIDNLNHLFTREEISSVCEYWNPEEEIEMNKFVTGNTSTVSVVTEKPDADPHTRISLELDEMEKVEPTTEDAVEALKKIITISSKWSNESKIIKLMDEPPLKKGTNRYRNMEAVLASQTVGEAITALRNLEPSPGGRMDLRIAEKANAIKIEEK